MPTSPTSSTLRTCPQCKKEFRGNERLCPHDGQLLTEARKPGAEPDPNLGQTLAGKYRIDGFVSRGGMGSVYRATHVMLGKPVAIKLINPALVTSEDTLKRFHREARAASLLSHPNIVTVHDLGQSEDGTLYIAMELVQGVSLKHAIVKGGPMKPERVARLGRQMCSALSLAHRNNIIHRDLKPQNVMLFTDAEGQETAKLLDFGIAKTFGADEGTQLTSTGTVLGTPQYMSPEQASGKPIDGRSDLYSLGVILYEMLAGEVPFNDNSITTVLYKHVWEAPKRPTEKRQGLAIPAALEEVVLRLLAKDPAKRHASADELAADLRSFDPAAGGTLSTPPEAAAGEGGQTMTLGHMQAAGAAAAAAPPAPATTPAPVAAAAAKDPTLHAAPATGAVPITRPTAPAGQVEATGTRPGAAPAASRAPLVAAVVLLGLLAAAAAALLLRPGRAAIEGTAAGTDQVPAGAPAMAFDRNAGEPARTSDERTGNSNASTAPGTGEQAGGGQRPATAAGEPAAGEPVAAGTSGQPVAEAEVERSAPVRPEPAAVAQLDAERAPAGAPPAAGRAARRERLEQRRDERATSATAEPAARPARLPAEPPVSVACEGAPDVCASLRATLARAFERHHLRMVPAAGRAEVRLSIHADLVEERAEQQFGTSFNVRTYSFELSAEAPRFDDYLSLPAPQPLSFDPRFGRDRLAERTRVIADDAAEHIRAYWDKKLAEP